jgi:hypothetical protein
VERGTGEAKVNYCCLCIIVNSSIANTHGYGLDTFAGGPDGAEWQEGKEQETTQYVHADTAADSSARTAIDHDNIDTAFRQQRLKAWQPILTPKTVLPLFFAVGVIFAPLGGLMLWASSQVQELSIEYQRCTRDATDTFSTIPSEYVSSHFKNATTPSQAPQWRTYNQTIPYHNGAVEIDTPVCQLQFWIPDDLPAPVLLYYQLTNFYQNHRRYVKSLSSSQLEGDFVDNSTIQGSDCDPLQLDASGKAYYPCGLIANSLFNDSFVTPRLLNGRNADGPVNYTMTNKGIAWSSDGALYKKTAYTADQVSPPPNWRLVYPEYNDTIPIPNIHDWEEFHVWMRTAGLPSFSKLALRNDNATMRSGQYEMEIYDCK